MNWNPRNRKYTKLIQKLLPAKYTAPLYLLMIKMSAILFRYELWKLTFCWERKKYTKQYCYIIQLLCFAYGISNAFDDVRNNYLQNLILSKFMQYTKGVLCGWVCNTQKVY